MYKYINIYYPSLCCALRMILVSSTPFIPSSMSWSTIIRWKPGLPAAARSNSRCCERNTRGG